MKITTLIRDLTFDVVYIVGAGVAICGLTALVCLLEADPRVQWGGSK